MADNDKKEEVTEEEEGGSSKKKIIIFSVIGALVLIGATVGGMMMFLGGDKPAADDEVVEEVVEEVIEILDPFYVKLGPGFTVNLQPGDPVAFLQVNLQILTFDEEISEALTKHRPTIKNNLGVIFSTQASADLKTMEGKEKLRVIVLEDIRKIIARFEDGEAAAKKVENVFFTSFVMQ